jgi:thiamine-phosphate pyrophosphorylase
LLYLGERGSGIGHERLQNMGAQRHGKLAEAARALNAACPGAAHLPPLFFFTDEVRVPDPLPAIAGLPEDCGVIFRHYGAEDRAMLAQAVVAACRAQSRICLIAGDIPLANAVGASGFHLPEHFIRTLKERPDAGIVTAAAHTLEGLKRAESLHVDAVFLSPVFATQSHEGRDGLGAERFKRWAGRTAVPVYALGGITDANADLLRGSGAAGLAAIGGLL